MAIKFQRAQKQQKKARINFDGIPSSGKTRGALRLARGLAPHGRIVVLDTESSSASLYADKIEGGYDVAVLTGDMRPRMFTDALHEAEAAGYDVVIIDSLSHAWRGTLELVDRQTAASRSKNSFNEGWRAATPEHNALVDAILQSPCHVITTMRSKSEWVVEEDERGKKVPRKIGMAPVAREGAEYEYDVCLSLDSNHKATVTKTRCDLLDEKVFPLVTEALGETLRAWLESGAPTTVPPPVVAPTAEVAHAAPVSGGAGGGASMPQAPAAAKEAPPPASAATPAPAVQSEETLAEGFAKAIHVAASLDALMAVADVIGVAVRSNKVTPEEKAALSSEFGKRRAELAKKAA